MHEGVEEVTQGIVYIAVAKDAGKIRFPEGICRNRGGFGDRQ